MGIQSAYRGFKTRKEMKEAGNDLPDLKAANVVAATLRIQAYYRGFKARKALRDQEARQAQARANVEEAALRVRLPGSSTKKVISHEAPKTPRQSIDLDSPPLQSRSISAPTAQRPTSKTSRQPTQNRPPVKPAPPRPPPARPPPARAPPSRPPPLSSALQSRVPPSNSPFSAGGQRIKKSGPQFVDERDGRRKTRKVLGPTPESVQEDRSSEFVHHPADVVYAAMTIQ